MQARSGRMKSTFMHDGLSTLGRRRCRARLGRCRIQRSASFVSATLHMSIEEPLGERIGYDDEYSNFVA
jgi:hypothetical protein